MTYETLQIIHEPNNSEGVIVIEVDRILTYENGNDRSNEIWLSAEVVAYRSLRKGDYIEVDTSTLRTRDFCHPVFKGKEHLVRFKSHGEFHNFFQRYRLYDEVKAWRQANSNQYKQISN